MKRIISFVLVIMACLSVFSAAYSNTNIKVLLWDDALTQALKAKLSTFEQETGIKVTLELVPSGSLLQKIGVGVSLKSSDYDLIAIDEPYVVKLSPLVVPFYSWPKAKVYTDTSEKSILPLALEAAKYNNVFVGLPVNGNVYLWMTRKDLIENPQYKKEFKDKYNYDLAAPKTFAQLLDMAKFFSEKGIPGFAPFTKPTEGSTCEAMFMFESFGTNAVDRVGGKYAVTLDKAKAVAAMNMYKELIKYAPAGALDMGHAERIAAFNQGKVFSMFQWPALVPGSEDPNNSMVAGKILYSAPPAGPGKRAAIRGSWVAAIPNAAKNKQAAAEFAYWWMSAKAGKELVKAGLTPAREDLLTNAELVKTNPWFKGIYDSLKFAVSRPRIAAYPEISEIIRRNWLEGISGKSTSEAAINKMVEELNNALKKFQ